MNTGRPAELPGGRAGAASQAETTAGADASATAAAATTETACVTPSAWARPHEDLWHSTLLHTTNRT